MGRKPSHSQEEVFKVADDLAAQGKEVTPNVLYDALGRRGSMTTIYKHLDAWTDQRKQVPAPVPVVVPDAVMEAFTATWRIASQEAAKEVTAVREKADADVKASARKLADAITTIERLEVESEADMTRVDMLERELSDAKRAAGVASTEAAKREAALSARVEQMQNQLAEQQTALQLSHDEHKAFRQDKADEVARLTREFTERLTSQTEAARVAEAEVSSLRGKLDDMARKLAIARDEANTAKSEVARLTTVAIQADAEIARLGAAAEQVDRTLADARRKLDEANTQALAVTAQLGNVTGQCEALRAQVESQQKLIEGFAGMTAPASQAGDGKTEKPASGKDAGKASK